MKANNLRAQNNGIFLTKNLFDNYLSRCGSSDSLLGFNIGICKHFRMIAPHSKAADIIYLYTFRSIHMVYKSNHKYMFLLTLFSAKTKSVALLFLYLIFQLNGLRRRDGYMNMYEKVMIIHLHRWWHHDSMSCYPAYCAFGDVMVSLHTNEKWMRYWRANQKQKNVQMWEW